MLIYCLTFDDYSICFDTNIVSNLKNELYRHIKYRSISYFTIAKIVLKSEWNYFENSNLNLNISYQCLTLIREIIFGLY